MHNDVTGEESNNFSMYKTNQFWANSETVLDFEWVRFSRANFQQLQLKYDAIQLHGAKWRWLKILIYKNWSVADKIMEGLLTYARRQKVDEYEKENRVLK